MDTNILTNIKYVTIRSCLYLLSNTYAKCEAQFKKKLSNIEARLKKRVALKKEGTSDFGLHSKVRILLFKFLNDG